MIAFIYIKRYDIGVRVVCTLDCAGLYISGVQKKASFGILGIIKTTWIGNFFVILGVQKKCLLAFSALSRLPRIEIFLQEKLQTMCHLRFDEIWSMSKLSKLDI